MGWGNSLRSSEKAFYVILEPGCSDLLPFGHRLVGACCLRYRWDGWNTIQDFFGQGPLCWDPVASTQRWGGCSFLHKALARRGANVDLKGLASCNIPITYFFLRIQQKIKKYTVWIYCIQQSFYYPLVNISNCAAETRQFKAKTNVPVL